MYSATGMTAAETTKFFSIKADITAKRSVSAANKQWVLDVINRLGLPIKSSVIHRAKNSGFNISGLIAL